MFIIIIIIIIIINIIIIILDCLPPTRISLLTGVNVRASTRFGMIYNYDLYFFFLIEGRIFILIESASVCYRFIFYQLTRDTNLWLIYFTLTRILKTRILYNQLNRDKSRLEKLTNRIPVTINQNLSKAPSFYNQKLMHPHEMIWCLELWRS